MADPNQDLDTLYGQDTYIQNNYAEVITEAANIRFGDNPAYTIADFVAFFPQFGSVNDQDVYTEIVPHAVLQLYINLASSCISYLRWGSGAWSIAMSLFVAHFATLYCQSVAPEGSTARQVAAMAQAKGIQVSKSAGPLSTSYETITKGIEDWGSFLLTEFGQQLATMGSIVGMGGMYIW